MLRRNNNQNVARVPTFGVPRPPPVSKPFDDSKSRRKKEDAGESEKRSANPLHDNVGSDRNNSDGHVHDGKPETVTKEVDNNSELWKETMRLYIRSHPEEAKQLVEILQKINNYSA
jgi:hypothetical protein